MEFKLEDGSVVNVPDNAVQEGVKDSQWYNSELDRVRIKGETTVRDTLTAEHSQKVADLTSDYDSKLESASKLSSGKKDEQIQELITMNQTLNGRIDGLISENQAKDLESKKGSLKATLANALAGNVADEFVRDSMISSTMQNTISTESGDLGFKVGDVVGNVDTVINDLKAKYPQHFTSNQPNGLGVKGGPAVQLPANASLEDKLRANIAETLKK